MQFSHLFALLATTLVDGAVATTLERRSTIVSCGLSNLAQPTSGTLVHPGDVIPFHFVASNWCNAGYTPVSAWLLTSPAEGSDINGSGQFDNALFHFGDYLQRNILRESYVALMGWIENSSPIVASSSSDGHPTTSQPYDPRSRR